MEIEYKDDKKDNAISFGDIPQGEVFINDDKIYIKTDTIPIATGSIDYLVIAKANAINAKTGNHDYFSDNYKVKWLKYVKLTIE